jgi:hypothetical protein
MWLARSLAITLHPEITAAAQISLAGSSGPNPAASHRPIASCVCTQVEETIERRNCEKIREHLQVSSCFVRLKPHRIKDCAASSFNDDRFGLADNLLAGSARQFRARGGGLHARLRRWHAVRHVLTLEDIVANPRGRVRGDALAREIGGAGDACKRRRGGRQCCGNDPKRVIIIDRYYYFNLKQNEARNDFSRHDWNHNANT